MYTEKFGSPRITLKINCFCEKAEQIMKNSMNFFAWQKSDIFTILYTGNALEIICLHITLISIGIYATKKVKK